MTNSNNNSEKEQPVSAEKNEKRGGKKSIFNIVIWCIAIFGIYRACFSGDQKITEDNKITVESKITETKKVTEPDKVTDSWHYYFSETDTIKVFNNLENGNLTENDTLEFIKKMSDHEFQKDAVSALSDGTTIATITKYNLRGDEVIQAYYKGLLGENEKRITRFKGPIQIGTVIDEAKITAINQEVETIAGKYNDCIKTEHSWDTDDGNDHRIQFYCRNIGLVSSKIITTKGSEKTESATVLANMHLASEAESIQRVIEDDIQKILN